MRSRTSESLIVLPLLPIFLIGLPPMLLLSLLGFAGLVILGILVVCVGLSDSLDANHAFNEQVIVHGYARRIGTRRAGLEPAFGDPFRHAHDGDRRRFIVAGVVGFFWFG